MATAERDEAGVVNKSNHKPAFLGGIRSISVAIQFLETRGQSRA